MVNYVYFILAGQCRLIEHMNIEENISGQRKQYKIYNPEARNSKSQERFGKSDRKPAVSNRYEKRMDMMWNVSLYAE